MNQYLTYQQYVSLGGTAEMSAFPLLERRARAKLDYWTMNRITDVDGDIQLCMTLIVNALDNVQKSSRGRPRLCGDNGPRRFPLSGGGRHK